MQTLRKGSRGEDVKTLQRLLNLYEDGIFGKLTEESVKAYQSSHGLTVDGIVGEQTWKQLQNETGYMKSRRKITEIIIHSTATVDGKNFTVADIRRWHKARGWSDIGYHYVIYRDGSVHEGRNVNISGAHCPNHNYCSIGICYIGGLSADGTKEQDTRTNVQKASMEILLRKMRTLYPGAKIYGHRDFCKTACPSFDAKKEYSKI